VIVVVTAVDDDRWRRVVLPIHDRFVIHVFSARSATAETNCGTDERDRRANAP
jgi:hypothetical protein